MARQPLQLGFIGGGINSAVGATHKIASQMDNRWKVVAGCFSKSTSINQRTAEEWGISSDRVYADWKEMTASEKNRLDAIAVLTPTPLHAEIVTEVLKSGLSVICEKALAVSSEEALQIKYTAESTGTALFVTYNYTGYPMVRELKAMIGRGALGKILHIQLEMPQEGYLRRNTSGEPNRPQDWRLQDFEIPVVSLDLGTHLHNMIYFLTGAFPESLVAEQNSFGCFDVIDHVTCQARYSDDIAVQMWYGKSSLGYRNGLRIRIFGDKAAAEWYQLEPEHLKLSNSTGEIQLIDRSTLSLEAAALLRYNRFKAGHPSGFIEAFGNYYDDIADALHAFNENGRYESKYVFGAAHAAAGLQMLEVIARSSRTRQWESIL